MHENWKSKYLTVLIVLLAFVDGMLVAQGFQDEQVAPVNGIALEDDFEQKMSSTTEISVEFQKVPFTVQAPYGTWEDPWASFAEEACAYMAKRWADGQDLESKEEVANAFLAARDWELENLGTYKDTDILQIFRLLTEFYTLQAQVSSEVTEGEIQAQLDAGNILLIPVQNLENPYYGEPGPVHHVLLIYAYKGSEFLTNDPGTLRGEGYRYDMQKILEAVQDLNGERRMIILSR